MDLRVLLVEDSVDDAELVLRRLRDAGFELTWDRVATESGLRDAIAAGDWDVVLVDYNLPGFSGLEALHVLAGAAPTLPAITVSGAISEDTAVATITAGAVDYVLKDNLTRLAPAVQRAVEGADLRRRQQRAAEQARRTQFAIDHSSQVIAFVAQDGTITYANAAAEQLGEAPRDEIVGSKAWEWAAISDAERWEQLWTAAVRHPPLRFEAVMRTTAGAERALAVSLDYLEAEGGAFLVMYARDVTERKQAQEALRRREAQLRTLVDTLPDLVWFKDTDNVYRECNRRAESFFGAAEKDIVGRSDYELLDADLARSLAGEDSAAMETDDITKIEEELVFAADGHRELVETIKTPIREADGKLLGLLGISRDITERKLAEEALRESERRFAAFADHMPGLLWIRDPALRYLYVNPVLAGALGGAPDDFVGKTPEELWEADTAASSRDLCERALGGEVLDFEERWPDREDSGFFRSLVFSFGGEGDARLLGGLMFDITEQHAARNEVVRQAEQLRRTVQGAVLAMSHVVEMRDPYTAGHERRVAELAAAIAAEMGFAGEELEALRLAALIHDIGKIAVPAEILAKPGRLSDVEFNLIRQHPASGFDILEAIDFGRPVAEFVLQHHERLDGSGYPRGLVGDQVLPEARIIAVADVVEAMSSHRPYRAALGLDAALDEVSRHAGVKYDAAVVAACVRLFREQEFALTP